MAALGTVRSVVQNLTEALRSSNLKKTLSITSSESELEGLQNTVFVISDVFQKVERMDDFSFPNEVHKLIQGLKVAVFKAHNLVEEFVIIADNTIYKKKRSFFHLSENMRSFLHCGAAYKISKGVKKIRKELDAVVGDNRFRFVHNHEPIEKRVFETCSYVNECDIIGREQDLEKIVGILLDPDVERIVSFLSIFGIGGIGKTALAHLVFNDPRVATAFPLRLWTSIPYRNQKQLDVKEVLTNILARATNVEISTMDEVYSKLRQILGNKYLLVLDDVWTENREEWCRLEKYLVGNQRGSWIVVTTRSQRTATIIDGQSYELQGLSRENSWRLFERATTYLEESNLPPGLIQIGKDIVDRCAGNPFALRVVGSRLYGRESRWHEYHDLMCRSELNIRVEEGIIPVLKLSYNYLESPLKSCFSYCVLFPRDFTINKDMLISLWMAHAELSIEDVGDEYFSTLLERCFFKDIKKDRYGEIVSCKIQDLISILAQHVAEKEMHIMSNSLDKLDEGVHHVSVLGGQCVGNAFLGNTNILSFLHVGYNKNQPCNVAKSSLELLLANCKRLKALDLSGLIFKSLPNSIGELLLLRYLNLAGNTDIEVLPKTITKLQKLQTLNLQKCIKLKALPEDLSKLVNLRLLNIRSCSSLTCMPRGIGKLVCLHKLSDFMLGDKGNSSNWEKVFDALEDLKPLDNLQHHLNLEIRCPNVKNVATGIASRQGLYPLKGKQRLNVSNKQKLTEYRLLRNKQD